MNGRFNLDQRIGRRIIPMLVLVTLLTIPLSAYAAPNTLQGNWWAEFFNNKSLSGSPVLTRYDGQIDFNWGTGSPGADVWSDNFSARWTRTEWFDSGTYRFYARSDDGLRVWVGNQLVVDAWEDRQAGWITRDLYVGQGTYPVRVEYFEHMGGARVTLKWERLTGGAGWQAEYYANQNLSGSPALRRAETAIDFDWGTGSPDTAIPADGFSARWTYTLGFTSGSYRFLTSTDDGVRLWVDGRLLVDAWYNQGLPNTHTGDINLNQGYHEIKVEYYEAGGEAHAHVWWQRLESNYTGWKGEYYPSRDLTGGPALVRDDAEIQFDWGTAPPVSWMPDDGFSVRWTRQMTFDPGYYRFSVRSDDGARIWLDGGLVIDKWQVMNNELHYVDGIYLSGLHQLKVEYFEQTGHARVHFWISPAGTPVPPTPPSSEPGTVLVDDTDVGFVRGGSSTGWRTAYEGYGGRMTWTRNNDWKRANYNWARWYPNLAPGRYEVFAFIPERYSTTSNARYWVAHASAYTLRTLDQSANGGRWVSLGTYWFDGGGDEYVSLADDTYETRLTRNIAFDAMKWVPR
jgi:hypothetical protein